VGDGWGPAAALKRGIAPSASQHGLGRDPLLTPNRSDPAVQEERRRAGRIPIRVQQETLKLRWRRSQERSRQQRHHVEDRELPFAGAGWLGALIQCILPGGLCVLFDGRPTGGEPAAAVVELGIACPSPSRAACCSSFPPTASGCAPARSPDKSNAIDLFHAGRRARLCPDCNAVRFCWWLHFPRGCEHCSSDPILLPLN